MANRQFCAHLQFSQHDLVHTSLGSASDLPNASLVPVQALLLVQDLADDVTEQIAAHRVAILAHPVTVDTVVPGLDLQQDGVVELLINSVLENDVAQVLSHVRQLQGSSHTNNQCQTYPIPWEYGMFQYNR